MLFLVKSYKAPITDEVNNDKSQDTGHREKYLLTVKYLER